MDPRPEAPPRGLPVGLRASRHLFPPPSRVSERRIQLDRLAEVFPPRLPAEDHARQPAALRRSADRMGAPPALRRPPGRRGPSAPVDIPRRPSLDFLRSLLARRDQPGPEHRSPPPPAHLSGLLRFGGVRRPPCASGEKRGRRDRAAPASGAPCRRIVPRPSQLPLLLQFGRRR